jgi:flavin prenyltransferase
MARRIIVGITGASGAIYGIRTLAALRASGIGTHLVVSKSALLTLRDECDMTLDDLRPLADVTHPAGDIGASIASGSFRTLGMIVAPCSARTLSNVAYGNTDNLVTRAADVTLKERRRLVLLVRETPLHAGHLEAMLKVTQMGAIVMPPVPAFYSRPRTLDEMVDQTVGRALDLFEIDAGLVRRWKDEPSSD